MNTHTHRQGIGSNEKKKPFKHFVILTRVYRFPPRDKTRGKKF